MTSERIRTQARLLTLVRPDGYLATALDTGNTFVYVTGVGWTEFVPVDGVVGQPLLAANRGGGSSFDSVNRLVPNSGTAGNIVGIDHYGSTQFLIKPAGPVLPVDFADGAIHTAYSFVVPGGVLGPTGLVKIRVYTQEKNTVGGRTITFIGGGLTITTPTLTAGAIEWESIFETYSQNRNDEAVQSNAGGLRTFKNGAWDSESIDSLGSTTAVDTTTDSTWTFTVQLSGTADTHALVSQVFVDLQYGS